MKKIQLLFLMLATLTASLTFTSCKKDEEPSNQTLLVKKWYYKSVASSNFSTTSFYVDDYWEFKANGTFEETWDWGNGNYSLINDQKTIVISFPSDAVRALASVSSENFKDAKPTTSASATRTYQFNITKLTATELEFTYQPEGGNLQTYKFSTTSNPERVRAK